jgi:ATP-binding cassette subfamily F protein 3
LGHELEKTGDEKTLHDLHDRLHELETLGGYIFNSQDRRNITGSWFCQCRPERPYKNSAVDGE